MLFFCHDLCTHPLYLILLAVKYYFSAWDDVGMQIAGKHLHSTQQAVIPSGSLGKGHPEFDLPMANICNMLFLCPGPSMCSVA